MLENLHSISSRPVADPFAGSRRKGGAESSPMGDSLDLSPEAEAQLRKLKQRDAEVRAHEKAHMAAAGGAAVGGPHYEYQKGPDGKQYAIGGHVDISVSSVEGDPAQKEENARKARRAALAPGQPSSQDRQVAAQAASMEAEAKTEKREENRTEREESANAAPASVEAPEVISGKQDGANLASPGESAFGRMAAEVYRNVAGMLDAPFEGQKGGLSLVV